MHFERDNSGHIPGFVVEVSLASSSRYRLKRDDIARMPGSVIPAGCFTHRFPCMSLPDGSVGMCSITRCFGGGTF